MTRRICTLLVVVAVPLVFAGVAAAGSSPTVSTGSASKIGDSGATLSGTINPQGSSTTYDFQYGLTTSYGLTTAAKSAGSGTKAVVKSAGIGSLIPGTAYHFRLVATNKFGTSVGADRTFTTGGHPPAAVATGPATSVGKTSATLTGTVNPNGEATSWTFQYGLTTSYGNEVFGGVLPATKTPMTVTWALQGIEPGVLFHYRIVATHGSTPSYGADQTFFTLPNPTPTPRVHASTMPRTARHKPFVLTTRGRIDGPSRIPSSLECGGSSASVLYFVGTKQVGFELAAVQPNCTFSTTNTFRHLPGVPRHHHVRSEKMTIVVHFRGNGYLAAADSRLERVTLG
jgi:hypothetical protein